MNGFKHINCLYQIQKIFIYNIFHLVYTQKCDYTGTHNIVIHYRFNNHYLYYINISFILINGC